MVGWNAATARTTNSGKFIFPGCTMELRPFEAVAAARVTGYIWISDNGYLDNMNIVVVFEYHYCCRRAAKTAPAASSSMRPLGSGTATDADTIGVEP